MPDARQMGRERGWGEVQERAWEGRGVSDQEAQEQTFG